jgi:hypothetical protein
MHASGKGPSSFAVRAGSMANARIYFEVLAISSLWLLTGCPKQSIADVNRNPARFSGRQIVVAGRVNDAFGALGTGVFQIDDGTGSLWVFCQTCSIPGKGTQITVAGRVEPNFTFSGRTFPLIMRETRK